MIDPWQNMPREEVTFRCMRITGKDESIEAKGAIGLDLLQDLVRIADNGRTAARTRATDARPEIVFDKTLIVGLVAHFSLAANAEGGGVERFFADCLACRIVELRHQTAGGGRGKMECLIPEGNVVIGQRKPKAVETVHVPVQAEVLKAGFHHGASYYQHLAFQRAVREGTVPLVSAEDGLKAVAMGLAAHRSIEEGRPVLMSEFGL